MEPPCADSGGCHSDYLLISITGIVMLIICVISFLFTRRRGVDIKARNVALLLVQAVASLIFLAGNIMIRSFFHLDRDNYLLSCKLWAIWLEAPPFGLLMSCYIARTYRFYYVFVVRRLPPLNYFQLLMILILPWLALAVGMQSNHGVSEKPTCTYKVGSQVGITFLHFSYPIILICGTWSIRHINFKFNEIGELSKGIISSAVILVTYVGVFAAERVNANRKHPKPRLEQTLRFVLVCGADLFVLSLLWISVAEPLLRNQASKRSDVGGMGHVLGIPDSDPTGLTQIPSTFDYSKPLDYLLQHRQFRESFLAFADSRLAGEIVHFYDEVRELNKIKETVQMVYMAEHIIDSYIETGSTMEINISHQMKSEILNTKDLADPNLFKRATTEALKMMRTNLERDYWQSHFFLELKTQMEYNTEADLEIFETPLWSPIHDPFDLER